MNFVVYSHLPFSRAGSSYFCKVKEKYLLETKNEKRKKNMKKEEKKKKKNRKNQKPITFLKH